MSFHDFYGIFGKSGLNMLLPTGLFKQLISIIILHCLNNLQWKSEVASSFPFFFTAKILTQVWQKFSKNQVLEAKAQNEKLFDTVSCLKFLIQVRTFIKHFTLLLKRNSSLTNIIIVLFCYHGNSKIIILTMHRYIYSEGCGSIYVWNCWS